ncbi:MAG: DUF4345 family protein [Gammaproteobacteria bacterium]
MFPKIVLIFFGLSFGAFGVWALISPAALANLIHLTPETPGALTEIRAFYGGLEIGLAAFLLRGAFHRPWMSGALLTLVAVAGGIALGRCVGLALDSSVSNMMLGALVWEAAGAVLGTLAYLKLQAH